MSDPADINDRLEAAAEKAEGGSQIIHDFANGSENSDVPTESGPIPTLAKLARNFGFTPFLDDYAALRAYTGPAGVVKVAVQNFRYGRFRRVATSPAGYTDDGGITIIGTNGWVWQRINFGKTHVDWFLPENWVEGVTDSAQAFQNAIDTVAARPGGGCVSIPNALGYFMSKGIVVRRGVELQGDSIFCENYQGAGPLGARLIFASDVALCVHVSGAVGSTDASGTPGLRRVIVTRTGSIPAGSEGVRVSGAYNSTLEDVFSDRQAKGFRFLGKGSSTDPALNGGLACSASRLYTGAISDAHFEVDSWPELRVTGGRAGINGTGNLAGTAFVRITSPQGGTGGSGPNTIVFTNFQFNQGQVGPSYWLEFINNTAGAGNQVVYEFTNCHVENISSAYIKSYANSQYIQKLQVTGGTLNTPAPLFALDAATSLNDVTFNGVDIAASTLSIASLYVNGLKFNACSFSGCTATLTAPTSNNWVVSFSGNAWQATSSLTLAGAGWASAHVNDVFGFDSTVTDNTGSKSVYVTSIKRNLALWTPALQIGGASTGITYSSTSGVWQLNGRMLTLNFRIILTSKGALTGPVTIGNLPFPPAGQALDGHSGCIGYAKNFAGLTGALMLRVQDTSKLEIQQSNATGNASLTEANITNTTFVTGSITYAI